LPPWGGTECELYVVLHRDA